MKAIAILDLIEMPTVCKECRFREGALKGDDLVWLCHLNDEYVELDTKSDYCPLKPLPERWEGELENTHPLSVYSQGMRDGFNMCLEEITE